MDEPDLPPDVDMTIVRRWVCEECGKSGRRRSHCECGSCFLDTKRVLQFLIAK